MPIRPEHRFFYPSNGRSSPTRSASAGHAGGARNAPVRTCSGSSTLGMAGGGMPRSRAGATARAAGSGSGCATKTCSLGSASRRWCWPLRIAITTRPTTRTPTWRRSASAVTCCTTATSISAAAGAPCSGARPWATCSKGRIWLQSDLLDDALGMTGEVVRTMGFYSEI